MQFVIAYLASLVTFVLLDAAWLMLVAIDQFQSALGPILRSEPDLSAAVAFYLVFVGGLTFLATRPALHARSANVAVMYGGVLGLTAYATFDLTNLAILSGWTPGLAALDMIWGTALSAIAALAGYAVARRLRST